VLIYTNVHIIDAPPVILSVFCAWKAAVPLTPELFICMTSGLRAFPVLTHIYNLDPVATPSEDLCKIKNATLGAIITISWVARLASVPRE
jgi:hypothetical protein